MSQFSRNQLPVAGTAMTARPPISQGVSSRKLRNAYDVNSQVFFQPIREGPDEAIAEHRPHGCRRLWASPGAGRGSEYAWR